MADDRAAGSKPHTAPDTLELHDLNAHATSSGSLTSPTDETGSMDYRLYKRRFFGLAQLVLLNVIVSWDVSLLPESALVRIGRDTSAKQSPPSSG